jgi:hypothetical protein
MEKEGYVGAQRSSHGNHRTLIPTEPEESIQAKHRSCGIAATPTQSCPNGDSFLDMDVDRIMRLSSAKQEISRLIG